MAASELPQTPTQMNETPAVSLPPLTQTPSKSATTFVRLRGWLDAMLVVVVVLFAFLVVSFPGYNSDFFRHAALGRLLLQGQYHFGIDPFVYTGGDAYFVNHSWLFDLLMYGLYRHQAADAGAVVVILKALTIAMLAVFLLVAGRRSGQGLWVPAVCTALAVLTASPRLYLSVQSTCLSCLFLGVTIFIVASGKKRLWWCLLPLFALWVNCDAWFFMGPLTVALYLVGELLLPARAGSGSEGNLKPSFILPARIGTVGWLVLVLGIAACLANPHHVRALTLPPELGLTPAGDLLEHDPQFHALFLSPLGKDYYKPYFGLSVAGLAYWPLVLVSLSSFAFVFKRMPWPWLLVWTGFTLISLYNWRAIPFFAIVAGPIAALNWLSFADQFLGPTLRVRSGWRNWALVGRATTLLLGLVLLIATVPGWLQKSQPSFHRIGWKVQVEPSLQAMAEAIRGWREAGLLPDEPHWFNMYAEIANYVAWFAPGERVFLDQYLPYSRETTENYLDIRKGLEQEGERDPAVLKTDWQKILHDWHVDFWIIDNLGTQADVAAQLVLYSQSQQWTLCHLKGRIAIFARRDLQQLGPEPAARLGLDLKLAAFGPNADLAPPRGTEPAPPRDWWQTCRDAWLRPDPPLSSDRESIALYDVHYQAVEIPQQIANYARIWQRAVAAAAVAAPLSHGFIPGSLLALSWSCTYNDLFPPGAMRPAHQPRKSDKSALQAQVHYVNSQFIEPPSLYLAVRAARRALLANPEDEITYFRLGQLYQRLRDLPQESQLRNLPAQFAPVWVDAIRRAQMATAFQNCLRLQTDDDKAAEAHKALFELYYRDLGYIDAAVHHLRQWRDKRTAAGPSPGMTRTQHNQMLDGISNELSRLDSELERRLNRYEVNAATKTGLEKVQVALQEGLSETALNVLEREAGTNISSSNDLSILKMVTGMALDLGQADKAREMLPDAEGKPVSPDDLELYVRLAAARGDYAEADRLLDDALRNAWQPKGQLRLSAPNALAVSLVGRVLLAESQHLMAAPIMPWATNNPADIFQRPLLIQNGSEFWRRRWRLEAIINALLSSQQQATWHMMRGWLALEAGRCSEARKYFQIVRDISVPSTHWAPEVTQLNAWLEPQLERAGLQQLGFRHALLHEQSERYLRWLPEF